MFQSAVGHSAALHYLARTFEWTAPSTDVGELQFVYVRHDHTVCYIYFFYILWLLII